MPTITFIVKGKPQVVSVNDGDTILATAQAHNIPMEAACGGNGFCTTCKCRIVKGAESLGPRSSQEENLGVTDAAERLGCQSTVHGDIEVEVLEV